MSQKPSQEEIRKRVEELHRMPVPPELQDMITRSRAEFISEMSIAWERSTEPLILVMKKMAMEMQKAGPQPPTAKQPPRQQRRKAERDSIKKKPDNSIK